MGQEPVCDNPVILNGTFTGPDHWDWGASWFNIADMAIWDSDFGGLSLTQTNIAVTQNNLYGLTFTISNSWFDVGGGTKIQLGNDDGSGQIINTNGTFTCFRHANADTVSLKFNPVSIGAGGYLELDNVSIECLEDYIINDLGMIWHTPQKVEMYPGTGADISAIIASRTDNTNCGILFDIE